MINPLGSSIPGASIAATTAEFERPASRPEPARHVTPVGPALSGEMPDADAGMPGARAGASTAQGGLDAMNPLEKALQLVNNNLKAWSTGMRFDLDAEAQRVVVSIIDSETGEVLRTVPSDAVIRVAKMIVQLQGKSINTQA